MPATNEGKRFAPVQCLALSEQVKDVSTVLEGIVNDVMVTSVDYDGKGNARVVGYSVQEKRN